MVPCFVPLRVPELPGLIVVKRSTPSSSVGIRPEAVGAKSWALYSHAITCCDIRLQSLNQGIRDRPPVCIKNSVTGFDSLSRHVRRFRLSLQRLRVETDMKKRPTVCRGRCPEYFIGPSIEHLIATAENDIEEAVFRYLLGNRQFSRWKPSRDHRFPRFLSACSYRWGGRGDDRSPGKSHIDDGWSRLPARNGRNEYAPDATHEVVRHRKDLDDGHKSNISLDHQ